MLTFLMFLIISLTPSQFDSSNFYVESIEAQTTYDSRYIFERASRIVPPEKLVGMNDIQCLVTELKASGIFEDVKAEVTVTGSNTRKLLLSCRYRSDIDRFVISEIVLDGVPYADKAKFRTELNRRGVKAGVPFIKYYFRSLEEKINKAFRVSLPKDMASKFSGWTSITIRPAEAGKIKVTVSQESGSCGN
jgi:hypothetical protein